MKDKDINEIIKAYTELECLSKKYSHFARDYTLSNFFSNEDSSILKWAKVIKKYKINLRLSQCRGRVFYEVNRHMKIYAITDRRNISWEDDGRKPRLGSYVLVINFSTGAFTFGEDYPVEFFQKFFNEIKEYNPDFIDSRNSSLYWKMENASEIFNKFTDILTKYRKLNEEDIKKRKIIEMENRLSKLKND